jgi:hypothetical protein
MVAGGIGRACNAVFWVRTLVRERAAGGNGIVVAGDPG